MRSSFFDLGGSSFARGYGIRSPPTALKGQPGREIGISGSITLIGSLLKMGLLDELRLLVFPVAVGSGKRLFEADEQVPLRLVNSKAFQTGVLSLTYGPAQA